MLKREQPLFSRIGTEQGLSSAAADGSAEIVCRTGTQQSGGGAARSVFMGCPCTWKDQERERCMTMTKTADDAERSRRIKRNRRRRRIRRLRRLGRMAGFLLCAGLVLAAAGKFAMQLSGGGGTEAASTWEGFGDFFEKGDPDTSMPDLSDLYSSHAVLAEADTGRILAERGGSDKIYPASLTKIMTALLVVERTDSLDETVTLPEDIFPLLYAQDASVAGFLPGETVTLRDLLYGILLPSGAECCETCAIRIAGSEEGFVELMNEKAEELGLQHTHFCNSTGLHDKDHYSTAEDLAALLTYALKDGDFRAVFTSRRYSTQPSNRHPDGITFYSTMFKDLETDEVTNGRILGGKTGYTQEAGLCLASLAQIGDREYVLVTAKAKGDHDSSPFHILDAVKVYDQL